MPDICAQRSYLTTVLLEKEGLAQQRQCTKYTRPILLSRMNDRVERAD